MIIGMGMRGMPPGAGQPPGMMGPRGMPAQAGMQAQQFQMRVSVRGSMPDKNVSD